jgi:hypothetical protein
VRQRDDHRHHERDADKRDLGRGTGLPGRNVGVAGVAGELDAPAELAVQQLRVEVGHRTTIATVGSAKWSRESHRSVPSRRFGNPFTGLMLSAPAPPPIRPERPRLPGYDETAWLAAGGRTAGIVLGVPLARRRKSHGDGNTRNRPG